MKLFGYKSHDIFGVLFLFFGILAVTIAIFITPTFAINYISPDHNITPDGFKQFNSYRLALSIGGILSIVSGLTLMKVKNLEEKLHPLLSLFQPGPIQISLYGILSTLLLFSGFFTNFWQSADDTWFRNQNYDMESFVVGRLVQSRQEGIFSYRGLTGIGGPSPSMGNYEYQAYAYANNLSFGSYRTYNSQNGGQGILFSLLDNLIHSSPQGKLQIFYALTSLLSAFAITAIVLWFYLEFGLFVSLFVLASAIISPWLTVFGGKLWWSMWSFYLPIIVIMYYLKNKNPTFHRHITLGILVFIAVFVKCFFTGYEYITTTLIMMMVPFVYYGYLHRLNIRKFIGGFFIAVFSSFLAILLSFTILCIQIATFSGSLLKGFDHIVYSLEIRTFGDPNSFPAIYTASLESHTADVVMTYLKGSFFGPTKAGSFGVTYLILVFVFMIASVFLYIMRNKYSDKEKRKSSQALVIATWFSLLAPLSWFVIFKAHSYLHTHMNYIVWQMPFTMFGFALCGLLLRTALVGSIPPLPSPRHIKYAQRNKKNPDQDKPLD